jgi:hypothetical protein
MKSLIAAVCFMLAAAPAAFAQDKAKDTDKKAPTATEKSAKGDMAKGEVKGGMAKSKGDDMKSGAGMDKSGKGMDKGDKGDKKAKKEPTEKQKAQQDKMKGCNKDAGEKKMKGDERKAFMKDCLSK